MGKTKDVRAAVEAELGFDPLVDSADIKVMNMRGRCDTRRHGAELPAVCGGGGRRAEGRRGEPGCTTT